MRSSLHTGHLGCLLLLCTILLLTGCKEKPVSDEPSDAIAEAWEYHNIGEKYDREDKKRLAEYYFRKSYNIIKEDPDQDFDLYIGAGYGYSCLTLLRGNIEDGLTVLSDILAVMEHRKNMSKKDLTTLAAFLTSMAYCQEILGQYDESKATMARSYKTMSEVAGGECKGDFNMVITCTNIFQTYYTIGDYEEASKWLKRGYEELYAYEKLDDVDTDLIEEYYGILTVFQCYLLQAEGKGKEADSIFDAIPANRLAAYNSFENATEYLVSAKRYAEAADMFNKLDSIYVRDSIHMTFDMISDNLGKRYTVNRHAGRIQEALGFADKAFLAIDSALVWQKQSDAAELAIIYQTHQKELELEESKVQARIRSILLYTALVVILLIAFLLLRAIHFNRVLSEKNRKLYEEIELNRKEQQHEMEQLQAAPEAELTTEQQIYRRLCALMDEQEPYTDENLNRDVLAQLLGTNAKYVEQAIRQCSKGETVSDFINRYRLEQIARLLKETDDPIAIIGEQCGIPSRATLARLFRNTYGMTPTEYRDI